MRSAPRACAQVFSDYALISRYVEVEVALARAEARCGVIPTEAAEEIAARSKVDTLDFDLLRHETDIVGYPILPLVHQLVKQCGEAGRYVHWGATTQDIMDTAVVLQVRDGLEVIEEDIAALRTHPRRPGEDATATRRWPAAPTCSRPCRSPSATRPRSGSPCSTAMPSAWSSSSPGCWSAQFAGAAGTLGLARRQGARGAEGILRGAGPRRAGLDLACRPRRLRGGREPARPDHRLARQDRLDVMLMASTEFAEVYEPFVKGRGASSTMPQKRNPISSELMLAASKGVRQHAGLMLDAMIHDFERATGPWHAEWIAIPESFVLTAGALHQAKFALGGLIVDEKRMRQEPRPEQGADRRRGGDDGAWLRRSAASRRMTSSMPPAAPSTRRAARWPRSCAAEPEVSGHLDRAAIDAPDRPGQLSRPGAADGRPGAPLDAAQHLKSTS